MSSPPSIDDRDRDRRLFSNNLMRELCQMDYYASRRNGKSNEFRIANIISIQAFGGDLKDQLLRV